MKNELVHIQEINTYNEAFHALPTLKVIEMLEQELIYIKAKLTDQRIYRIKSEFFRLTNRKNYVEAGIEHYSTLTPEQQAERKYDYPLRHLMMAMTGSGIFWNEFIEEVQVKLGRVGRIVYISDNKPMMLEAELDGDQAALIEVYEPTNKAVYITDNRLLCEMNLESIIRLNGLKIS